MVKNKNELVVHIKVCKQCNIKVYMHTNTLLYLFLILKIYIFNGFNAGCSKMIYIN